MPGWWKGIFLLTVIWSGVYLVGIELNLLDRYGDTLKKEQKELAAQRQRYREAQPPVVVTPELLAQVIQDEQRVLDGAQIFASNCASCHGAQAQGQIGPNLTDDHWLYGQEPMQVHAVIDQGTQKGMPAWGSILDPQELLALVAYVRSTHHTNPPDAKAPEGEKFEPVPIDP